MAKLYGTHQADMAQWLPAWPDGLSLTLSLPKEQVHSDVYWYSFFYFWLPLSPVQNKSEGQLFERFAISWKFGKLVSAIIEKSWPSESHQEDEETILQHLLSWTAAKNIFQLHGMSSVKTMNLFKNIQIIWCWHVGHRSDTISTVGN